MPGHVPYMMPGSYTDAGAASRVEPANGSHWGFVFWLIVYFVAAAAILGGLQIGGFSFVFRHR